MTVNGLGSESYLRARSSSSMHLVNKELDNPANGTATLDSRGARGRGRPLICDVLDYV